MTWKAKVLYLATFVLSVNSRPPGDVKAYSEAVCLKIGRGIYEAANVHWCCYCPEGRFKSKDCRHGEPDSTVCERCIFDPDDPTKQTYMDVENNHTKCHRSITERDCLKKMNAHFILGSQKRPSRCECKDGHYSASETLIYGCNKHSPCDPGYYPVETGTKTTDTRCTNCPQGTYSDESSPTATCMNFTKCQPDEIETAGSSSSNVICVNNSSSTKIPLETTTTDEYTEQAVEEIAPTQIIDHLLEAITVISAVVLACFVVHRIRNGCGSNNGTKHLISKHHKDGQCDFPENRVPFTHEKKDPETYTDVKYKKASMVEDAGEGTTDMSESRDADLCNSREDAIESRHITNGRWSGNSQDGNMKKHTNGYSRSVVGEIIGLINGMNLDSLNFKTIEIKVKDIIHDEKLVPEMLKSLIEYSTNDLLQPYILTFPVYTESKNTETGINDDHTADATKVRYQSLMGCTDKHGCPLTPLYLLSINDYFPKGFRDAMLNVILGKLLNLVGRVENKPD